MIGLFLMVALVCAEKVYKYIDAAFLERTQRRAAALAGDVDIQFLDFVSREIAALESTPPAAADSFTGQPSTKVVRCTATEMCDYGYYMKYHPSLGFRIYKTPLKGVQLRDECLKAERFYAELNDGITCD